MIDVRAIGQDHIGKGAAVLVVAVGLDRDLFPEGEVGSGVLGLLAERLGSLRAVDAVVLPYQGASLKRMDQTRMRNEDSLARDIGQGHHDEMVGRQCVAFECGLVLLHPPLACPTVDHCHCYCRVGGG